MKKVNKSIIKKCFDKGCYYHNGWVSNGHFAFKIELAQKKTPELTKENIEMFFKLNGSDIIEKYPGLARIVRDDFDEHKKISKTNILLQQVNNTFYRCFISSDGKEKRWFNEGAINFLEVDTIGLPEETELCTFDGGIIVSATKLEEFSFVY